MKKKLLSLVLAGAMVASTSVSAFAEGVKSPDVVESPNGAQSADGVISQTPSEAILPKDYTVTDTAADANISIEGKIANEKNVLPPSTISVSVPTSASFTVDKNGNLIGSNINITSQSNEEIEVLAYKFNDTTGTEYINVVDSNTLEGSSNKKQVSLRLSGNGGSVSLKTTNNDSESGICDLNTSNNISGGKVIGKVSNGNALTLKLEGDAVKKGDALKSAVKDTFTLTLKLRKKA